jgi:hypothetical protein
MRNKPIDSRTDVDVPLWLTGENLLGNPKVLVEVMTSRYTASVMIVVQTGIGRGDDPLFLELV